MPKDNFIRLQFDGFTSSQNNNKTMKSDKYQVTPKAEYSSMDEVVYEYMNNFDTLMEKVEDVVKTIHKYSTLNVLTTGIRMQQLLCLSKWVMAIPFISERFGLKRKVP